MIIPEAAGGAPVMLFDGVCNLCSGWVRFAIARDPAARLRFAAVQSPLGQAFLARHGLPLDVYDSFYFVEDGVVYEKSTAWFRMVRHLRWPWPWFRAGAIVPRGLRDVVYALSRAIVTVGSGGARSAWCRRPTSSRGLSA